MMMRMTNSVPNGYEMLYLEINVFCVVLLMILVLRRNDLKGIRWQKILNRCYGAVSASFISDALWVMMLDGAIPMEGHVFHLLKSIYFLSVSLMGYFWYLYSENIVNRRFEKHPERMKYYSVLCLAEGVLLIINCFCPLLFARQADGNYARGPLFLVQYLLAYIYAIVAAVDALHASRREENIANRDTYRLYALFPLAPAIAGTLQFFFPSLPALCCTITCILLLIYLKTVSTLVSLDPLTQLNNRRRVLLRLPEMMRNPVPDTELWVMMMDLDRFKQINDTHGHLRGDDALRQTAMALKKASNQLKRRAVIGRYGGDEFIMLVQLTDQENIRDLKEKIEQAVENSAAEVPDGMPLEISVGCARWEEGMSITELISAADRELYTEKRKRHDLR